MTPKEKIILSVAGGLASLTLGYLVWRHENSISQSEAAQNNAAAAAAQQENDQNLENALQTQYYGGSSEGSGGISEPETSSDSADSNVSSAGDSNIEAILQAFFGNQSTSGTGTPANGTPVMGPSGSAPSPPVSPVNGTPVMGPSGSAPSGPSIPVLPVNGTPVMGPSGSAPSSGALPANGAPVKSINPINY